MSYIIIEGNPLSGYNFHGPFSDPDGATSYVDTDLPDVGDWWVAPLVNPEAEQPLPLHYPGAAVPIPTVTEDQPVPRGSATIAQRLDWLHSNVQELEDRGVELPMGEYINVYAIIEDARDRLSTLSDRTR